MKNRILLKLKEDTEGFISGERLSDELGISRTAVWKHIKELRKDGYIVASSPSKGYRLDNKPDILNSFEISHGLNTCFLGKNVEHFKVIGSTNDYAKKRAQEGCTEGTVVVADAQESGRGRLGRTWSSLDSKGIWMSVVLKPDLSPYDVQIITLAASVAVVSAIEKVTGIQSGIKWPNDVLLKGKKICGILTEMSSEMERVNYLILGIGLNVSQQKEDFPEELWDTATSISMYLNDIKHTVTTFKRSDIIKSILSELEILYMEICNGKSCNILNKWRKYSVVIGKRIKVIYKNSEIYGFAVDIMNDGRLIVHCDDGETREIISGEVSIRNVQIQDKIRG